MDTMRSCVPWCALVVWWMSGLSSVTCLGIRSALEAITCTIPQVPVGAAANLTCHLPAQTSDWRQVSIQGYRAGHTPDSILDCDRSGGELRCLVYATNFVFNKSAMISDTEVWIEIEKAGPADEIMYKCQVPGYTEAHTCSFRLASVTTPEAGAPHAGLSVAVWILAAGLVTLLLVVIVLTLIKRKRHSKRRGANGSKEGNLQKRKSDLLTKRVTNEEGIQLLTLNITELQDQLSATDSEKETLVKDKSHIQTQLEIARADANSLKQDLEAEKTHLAAEQRKMGKTKEELEAIRLERLNMLQEQNKLAQIPELQEKLNKEKEALENLQKWNTSMQAENNKIKDRRKEASELRATLQKNQSELQEAAENVRLLTETLKKNREELKEHDKSKSDLQKQLKVSDRDLRSLSTKVQALKKEGIIQKLQHENELLRQRLSAEGGVKEMLPPQSQKGEDGRETSNTVDGSQDWDMVESHYDN